MGNKWTKTQLKELLATKGYIRGPFGSALRRNELLDRGIPVYEQQNVIRKNQNFRFFIDDKKFEEMKRFAVQTNDLLISCSGTIGEVALITNSDAKGIISQALLALRPNTAKIAPKYLLYFFKSAEGHNSIISRSSGSVQVNIAKREVIESIPLFVPSLPEQNAIIATLSSLDGKIELNNRIIANLEAQAQAIFKSWFVDFEPFQDGEFEESELGLIPKGWRVGTLKDICHYSNDRVAVETLSDETYISTENMLPNKQGFVKAASLPTIAYTTAYHAGDVLISNIRPYFKKIVYCYGEGGCSTDVICFAGNDGFPPEYLFHLLYNDSFFDFMVGGSKGTKMPRGDKQQLMQYPVVLPDSKLICEFRKIAQPMLSQSHTLKQENVLLSQTRDTLLPKLMSGEIEVTVEG